MIIDSTYFIRGINIPSSAYSDLDMYIETYEKEMLINLLGYSLYSEFKAELDAEHDLIPAVLDDENNVITPEIPAVTLSEKWANFRDGLTYTYGGLTVRWNGLRNSDKISPIAFFVYCRYVEAKQVLLSTTGANQPKQENSTFADSVPKYVKAWNDFVELYGYSGQSINEGSALNFLLAHSDEYNSFTHVYGKRNIYGL